jgi:hypothetical protein
MKNFLIICALIFSASAFGADNPSFDCKKAKTPVEKTICKDPQLSVYDSMLAEAFQKNKANPQFQKDYSIWLKDRNSCNKEEPSFCLREKYAVIFSLILNKYDGFATPFIPDKQCFKPFLLEMNGDQGFYAVRVISSIRGCGNLNFNLNASEKDQVSFLNKKGNVYYYKYTEEDSGIYTIGVRYELKYVIQDGRPEPTLVMSLVSS